MEDLEDAANGDDQPPASAVGKFDQDQSRKRLHFNDQENGEDLPDNDDEEEEDDIDREDHGGYTSDPEIGTAKRSY